MFKKTHLFFLLIVGLAFFLRFIFLTKSPPGFYVDEAAVGYNAYSILKTGADEYGKKFPLFFRSFGDYKMPLNIYLTVLPVWIMGLEVFSVRFLPAFFGSLTTVLIYFLSIKIFKKESRLFALLASFVYAISPWSIFISRVGFEGNVAFFLLLLALLLQIKGIEIKNKKIIFASTFIYGLSVYSYHTERFIAPIIMVFVLLAEYWGTYKKNIFLISQQILFLFLLLLPQLLLFNSAAGQARIEALSLRGNNSNFFSLYSSYFSFKNLFFSPDPDLQRSYPQLSVFYPWMVIFFIVGIIDFFRQKIDKNKTIFLFLLMISPSPAALARDPFSTYRSYPLIFPLILIIGLGIKKLLLIFKLSFLKTLFILGIFFFSLLSLYRNAVVLLPRERFNNWSFGYEEMAEKIKTHPKVLINDELGVSYIELLFFLKYPPEEYQGQQKINLKDYYQLGQWNREIFWADISIRKIDFQKDVFVEQLIVAKPIDLSDSQAKEHFLAKSFVIMGLDDKILYNGYLTNPEQKKQDDFKKLQK